ncbi:MULTISPECIES: DUF3102 domain-containing protein [unclassified Oceanobacillus]|uniref:DUF3102 domain-containing protein n=1 Tax=unclassified Oceanobacillus TaxID=2630292 RepID=UPI00300E5F0F
MASIAGEAIFEIGRRLKHVKENDLAHGEWTEWLESIGMTQRHASRFVAVYDRFSKRTPESVLPKSITVLEALTSFSDEELTKEYELPSGEVKKPTEMSRREIEIGRRLKHVKENDLAHREWARWCEGEVGIDRSTANKFIRVFEELSEDVGTYPRLGLRALYEIATLPPEQREAEHTTSKGETKTPVEMTVKELRDLKRQLRAEQAERERLEEEATRLHTENAELAGKEPEVTKIFRKIFYLRLLKF